MGSISECRACSLLLQEAICTETTPTECQRSVCHSVNIDANWDLLNRSASGDLVPDPKLYPSGLNHTVSYVHSLGLGFGLCESLHWRCTHSVRFYHGRSLIADTLLRSDGDRGTMDCGKAPGQYGHEAHDSAWLGAHKIE